MFRKFAKTAAQASGLALPDSYAEIFSVTRLKRGARARNEAVIRHLCDNAYLGDDTALCRVLGRYKMYVDCRDIGVSPHLMLDGYWEMWVTEVLVSLVGKGMVVADIGANLGYFTILLADLVGASGQVHAFEPNPHMTGLLRRSLAVNGFSQRVQLHQLALGANNAGQVALLIPPDDPKNAHIVPIDGALPDTGIAVPLARLDGRPDWRAIEFAKIDVEGAEQLIWAGAQGLLDGTALKNVVLEFTAARYADPKNFLQALCAPGFTLAYIDFTRGIVEISPTEVLRRDPHVDIMLVLRR